MSNNCGKGKKTLNVVCQSDILNVVFQSDISNYSPAILKFGSVKPINFIIICFLQSFTSVIPHTICPITVNKVGKKEL